MARAKKRKISHSCGLSSCEHYDQSRPSKCSIYKSRLQCAKSLSARKANIHKQKNRKRNGPRA